VSIFLFVVAYLCLFTAVAAGGFNGFTLLALLLISAGLCASVKSEEKRP